LIYIHTICEGIKVYTKNRVEKQFIHFDSFLTNFVDYTNYAIFSISVKKFDLFDSSPTWIHKYTICVGIEVLQKLDSKSHLFNFIIFLTIFMGYGLQIMKFF
jgi:hypothetical protein